MAGNSKKFKKLKRSHAVDRLSLLPDNIIYHILSFLDTKSLVRTSLLSSKWRSLWKHVPVLNFLLDYFPNMSSFMKHITRILSTRFHSIPVRSITFDTCGDMSACVMRTFGKIMKYADSHGGGGLHQLSLINDRSECNLADLTDVITDSHHHESLKTLKLEGCLLWSCKFYLRFKSLTTLELHHCVLQPYSTGELFDPFGNMPSLNYLKLIECHVYDEEETGLIISGLELLDLEIRCLDFYGVYQVIAPKLKFLHLWGDDIDLPKLNLPALDRANIHLERHIPYRNAASEEEKRAFMNFLGSLRNAEFLQLRFKGKYYLRGQDHFPLNRIKASIKSETPPFTRLKTLRIQCTGQQKLPCLHYEVIRYFFEGSLSTEEKSIQLELVNENQC